MRIRNNSQRSAAALAAGALLLSFAGTVGLGSAADAEPEATPTPSSANIDFTKTGSLTLHKYEELAGSKLEGAVDSATDLTGLTKIDGAGFTIYQVTGIDLATEAGWDAAGDLSKSLGNTCPAAGGASGYEQTATGVTANGMVAFTGLDLGAYVVCETKLPAGVAAPSLPFLVTLPLPGTGSQAPWIYDVHAYPKNSSTSVVKDVRKVDGSPVDGRIEFTIDTKIPLVTGSKKLTKFEITDAVDARFSDVKVTKVELAGSPLTADTDYTAAAGNSVSVKIADSKLTAVAAAGGQSLKVTISATVQGGSADKLGSITNTANAHFEVDGNPTTTPSNEVHTNWGGFSILKYAKGSEAATLEGAEFSLFAGTVADGKCQPVKADNTVIASVKTDANGKASFPALFLGDSDDASKPAATTGCFALVETKAPAGYTLLEKPIAVTVNATGADVFPTINVENTKKAAVTLPLTGAAGQVLLTLGGVAAVAIAGGLMLVRRRNQAQAR
ncbi:SpaH/EbpB family LPXTG-anchored major pilin [Timonella senegalensis]|uniref:SpaH/EbpB family LPXTG-anchored major pilin n=1 Tax=Timonella senegalensis TaxID=1465825 RepID=UPI002FDD71FB